MTASGSRNATAGTSASVHASYNALEALIHVESSRYSLLEDLGIAGNVTGAQEPKLSSFSAADGSAALPLSLEQEGAPSSSILKTLGLQAGDLPPTQDGEYEPGRSKPNVPRLPLSGAVSTQSRVSTDPVEDVHHAQDSSGAAASASAEKDRLAIQQTADAMPASGLLDALLSSLPATQQAEPASKLPEGSGQSLSLLEPPANLSRVEQPGQKAPADISSLVDMLPSRPSQAGIAISTALAQAEPGKQASNEAAPSCQDLLVLNITARDDASPYAMAAQHSVTEFSFRSSRRKSQASVGLEGTTSDMQSTSIPTGGQLLPSRAGHPSETKATLLESQSPDTILSPVPRDVQVCD